MKVAFLESAYVNVQELSESVKSILQQKQNNFELVVFSTQEKLLTNQMIREQGIDLLVTFNLEGFERSTLMGGLTYNLFDCKQIHILLNSKLPGEKYLEKQLSISMFFYCAGKELYHYFLKKYEDIPYLDEMPVWKNNTEEKAIFENAEKISAVITKTADICHLQ